MAWQEVNGEAAQIAAKAAVKPVGRIPNQTTTKQPDGNDNRPAPPTDGPARFSKRWITDRWPRAASPKIGANRGNNLMIAENLSARGLVAAADNTARKQRERR